MFWGTGGGGGAYSRLGAQNYFIGGWVGRLFEAGRLFEVGRLIE